MIVVELIFLGLLVGATHSWGQYIGEVVHADGRTERLTGELQKQGSDEWAKLVYKNTVFLLDAIRTGPASSAKTLLEYQELDTIWSLFENGRIHFTEEEALCQVRGTAQPQQRIAYLDGGTIRSTISRRNGTAALAEVRTKNAVVCAVGTILTVRFIPPNTTLVIVLEGAAKVRTLAPASAWVQVKEGFSTRVVENQPPTTPTPLSSEALQRERQRRIIAQVPEVVRPMERLPESRLPEGPTDQVELSVPELVPGDPSVIFFESDLIGG